MRVFARIGLCVCVFVRARVCVWEGGGACVCLRVLVCVRLFARVCGRVGEATVCKKC